MTAQSIEVEIYPDEDGEGARADQERSLEWLRRESPDVNAEVVNVREGEEGILPVIPVLVIAGVLGAIALAKFIQNWICHEKRRGMIIDARGAKLKITKDADLPGGEVLIFAKDGSSKEVNVCDDKIEVGALVKALNAGASADGAATAAKKNGTTSNGSSDTGTGATGTAGTDKPSTGA